MDGEAAYNIYRSSMADQEIEVDSWQAIYPEDRVAWQAVVDEIKKVLREIR